MATGGTTYSSVGETLNCSQNTVTLALFSISLPVADMVAPVTETPRDDLASRLFPAEVKARAKSLYLVKGLQPRDIAPKIGVPVDLVYDWATRNGWAAMRRERLAQVSQKIEQALPNADQFMELVATESEEIALAGFERARGAVQSESEFAAKDFASWTSGVKNLVGMYRTAKGLDASQAGPQITFNAFYSPTAPKASQAESIDVTTTPAE